MTSALSLPDEKMRVRREVRERLASLSPQARARAGEAVLAHLRPVLDELAGGAVVALFASLPQEIDTSPLFEDLAARGLPRALPRVAGRDLEFHRVDKERGIGDLVRSGFGVPEPVATWPIVSLAECGLIVMPGLAFDRQGARLGYGRGYYDRALERTRALRRVPAVAICLDCQVLDEVPAGPQDQRIDALCSPSLGLVWL